VSIDARHSHRYRAKTYVESSVTSLLMVSLLVGLVITDLTAMGAASTTREVPRERASVTRGTDSCIVGKKGKGAFAMKVSVCKWVLSSSGCVEGEG
jgi:hypothetical protein